MTAYEGTRFGFTNMESNAIVVSNDAVNPSHYKSHPSGVECIDIVEHMGFNLGNAMKYIWRADLKESSPIQDLEKAKWYIEREIALRSKWTTKD